jgi:hypothetical protein
LFANGIALNNDKQKTRRKAGFFNESKTAENRYPACDNRQRRRARDVIPAAMRADVRISA